MTTKTGRPLAKGELRGDDMRIEWVLWKIGDDGRHPIDVAVTFKPSPEGAVELTARAEFAKDAIAFAKLTEEAWKSELVEMARLTVRSAVSAEV